MRPDAKRIVFYTTLLCVTLLLWAVVQTGRSSAKTTYSEFLQQVQSGQVRSATIVAGDEGSSDVTYNLKDGTRVHSVLPSDYRDALEAMRQKTVNVEIENAASQWLRRGANLIPVLLLAAFWFFMMRRLPGRGAK
jgi:cell division protease FtsH